MSDFNPDLFLDQSTTTAATRRPPVSSGLAFMGIIKDVKGRQAVGKKDPNKTYTFCDITIELDLSSHPTEIARLGTDKVTLRHSGIVDWENGTFDWGVGKNRFLAAYRDALNLNQEGSPFSLRMLIGRIVRAKVGHRQSEQIDPSTGRAEIYDEIDSVARV